MGGCQTWCKGLICAVQDNLSFGKINLKYAFSQVDGQTDRLEQN